ncbi:winged helix-turn-helix domain-containing protein [Rhizobium sp. BK251]|uniref:winged helix-turn-helix domain-containing protein n=1 Tax=Rhizobium sp. BK251 TaxID=2512125 RepID=UPI00104FF423|nr:winged helix-turn-helix domain-containing protein [Rhizobium sp. BK251]TCL73029.1 molybdate transport system regulatory protein [Rhizobium sp. BK251]
MHKAQQSDLRPVLRISFPGEDRLGRGKMELLEHIKDTGSISAAGRAMDMSYRRAWMLVSEMNRMFQEPVVESQRGGQKGGGAALTVFGEELVQRFRSMERTVRSAIANDLEWLDGKRNHSFTPKENPGEHVDP